jgi:hypothetical protein
MARAPYGQFSPPYGTALLTVCSQTVRILLDVATHVRGKHAGQAHNGGRVCTSWDRLVGSNPGIPTTTEPLPRGLRWRLGRVRCQGRTDRFPPTRR